MRHEIAATSPRLVALRKREQALKATIAAEAERELKRRERLHRKLVQLVGEALIRHGNNTAPFKLMVQQVLATVVSSDADRQFLKQTGWL